MKPPMIVAGLTACIAGAAQASLVHVEITGEVEFAGGPLSSQMSPGDPVSISFLLDSSNFVDGVMFQTRGYEIVQSSFIMTTGPTDWGLQNPYVGVPYFILRDNDPAVDGFLFGSDPDVGFPNGVALDQLGIFEQFRANYATTYGGDTLSSLDIRDAVGTYDFDGLTVFSFGILDGPADAAGFVFEQMTISIVPAPAAFALLAPIGLAARRRRRS